MFIRSPSFGMSVLILENIIGANAVLNNLR